jgi:ATP-dependent DNA helicase RecQ
MPKLLFLDIETDAIGAKVKDIGCWQKDGAPYHGGSVKRCIELINATEFIGGHNILLHDIPVLRKISGQADLAENKIIDTLFLSPLLFPARPYHRLVKDDKLQTEEKNNPVNDAQNAAMLFDDELTEWYNLSERWQAFYFHLLNNHPAFTTFFRLVGYQRSFSKEQVAGAIRKTLQQKICQHAPLAHLMETEPVALAYALSLIHASDQYAITPPWVLHQFPAVQRILYMLRGKPCIEGCEYCHQALDAHLALKRYFGYDDFRKYGGQPLQEQAVKSAVEGRSLLAIFPTGGGKSITFQLPALMAGAANKALTVVISPLQSLMKDQVDNLENRSITDAVTINGLLDPIERQKSIQRIEGLEPDTALANILYLSPESLRSVTIERLLLGRTISRIVVDEAHCFSSWGQDFRVDYLYIGDFIRNLQQKKGLQDPIPVSCFTATAKQKVVEDICLYFKEKLNLDLKIFRSEVARTNLRYEVIPKEDEDSKYAEVRRLLETKKCPAIIYVSRTRRAYELAMRLAADGFSALPYHGKMDKEEKVANQNAFIKGEVDIMVATSAFGMGVDKSNVGMVIHFEISDSLENYVQEAGRAGRDEQIQADCYVLFNEEDLDKHFLLLNQTKLDIKEINQIWKAIKDLDKRKGKIHQSALDIARQAGWDDSVRNIETRVTTAIAALEESKYVRRGQNMPRLYASSILAPSAQTAIDQINASSKFTDKDKTGAIRIIKKLFSSKSKRLATEEEAESRVDYIADHLSLVQDEVIRLIQLMRAEKILDDTKDLTAFVKRGEKLNKSLAVFEQMSRLERFAFHQLGDVEQVYNLKELNEAAAEAGCNQASPQKLRTLVNIWTVKHWIKRKPLEGSKNHIAMMLLQPRQEMLAKMERRHKIGEIVLRHLFEKLEQENKPVDDAEEWLVDFSILELCEVVARQSTLFGLNPTTSELEDCLFYLSRIEAIKLEGGFLVLYNKLTIERLEKNNLVKYKVEDYSKLKQFYESRSQQIHIVGEYARKMIEHYDEALQFVDDYFRLNQQSFLTKYFPGDRQTDISRTLTPAKFRQLFDNLSTQQLSIILDKKSERIVVGAGPGSGKTKLLVHKLASLLLTENVKHEQLLMLTFSKAAAIEFKSRLISLIGNAAHFVEIKTFHAYCFDLLGKVGRLEGAAQIIKEAVARIRDGSIERSHITKAVLVVDEAQDIDADEYELISAIIEVNEGIRVIAVGDDDQNIYTFRGADVRYLRALLDPGGAFYELVTNYRSVPELVQVSNEWVKNLHGRLKQTPLEPWRQEQGIITITQYQCRHLVEPLVKAIKKEPLAGTTCVLTQTNEEALQVVGLLRHYGITTRLIQSIESFNLYHLKELRWFTDAIERCGEGPLVTAEDWENLKRQFIQKFERSSLKNRCLLMMRQFEQVANIRKYKSDWKSFVLESRFEDFVQVQGETIFVSTTHKAKGKEFDNVFFLLNQFDPRSQEKCREFYVGITRAKNNLHIHYNGSFLQNLQADGLLHFSDANQYEPPHLITCILTHEDVQLGYFAFVAHRATDLLSGDTLKVSSEGLCNGRDELIVKFSKKFQERVAWHGARGYKLEAARVAYRVWWKAEDSDNSIEIILPEITFHRKIIGGRDI